MYCVAIDDVNHEEDSELVGIFHFRHSKQALNLRLPPNSNTALVANIVTRPPVISKTGMKKSSAVVAGGVTPSSLPSSTSAPNKRQKMCRVAESSNDQRCAVVTPPPSIKRAQVGKAASSTGTTASPSAVSSFPDFD